jgi:hypothetical protein
MSRKATLVLAALAGGAVFTVAAHADHDMDGYLGTPVPGTTVRVTKIDASTKFIKVDHLETLTIQNQKGQSFAWRFDTLHVPTGFPLRSIAPLTFDAGDTWVYVRPHGVSTTK